MKKIAILGLCLAFGLGASAQVKLAKEVERNTKKNYAEAVKQMAPVLTNPETAKDAFPRYVVGKAGMEQYDELFAKKQLGMDVKDLDMANDLLGGYGYMMEALALDTVVDNKGKVKTKYSKDIINSVGGHFNDFNNAAVYYWEAEDFKNAINAWQAYIDIAKDPRFAGAIQQPADSVLQNTIFNQALGAYNLQDKPTALAKFMEVMSYGESKKHVYDYALAVAQELDLNDEILKICEAALPLYGNEEPLYLINIINVYNKKGDYPNASRMVNEAIAKSPNDPQLWRVKGYLLEYQDDVEGAFDAYKKTVEVDSEFVPGLYDYSRSIFNKGMRLEDATSQEDYAKVLKDQLIPMYTQAKELLTKAQSLCEDDAMMDQIDKLMENLNYKLGVQ